METDFPASAATERSPRGYSWIPTMEVEPGMEIARPVLSRSGMQLAIQLAVGSVITASTITQLINKGVECVAILHDAEPDEASYDDLVRRYESRLHEIFGSNTDANCQLLLEALLADGP